MAKKITIYEVAKKAGVGIGTVSRAMNDSPLINIDTKNHVLEIARELNYQPHAVAQSLARKRTNAIGIIVPFFTNYFFVELLRGIQNFITKFNYDLILYSVDNVARGCEVLDRVIQERRVDGVLYISMPMADQDAEHFKKLSLPIVMVDNRHGMLDSIVIDNEEGAFTATNHLIGLGHRRIAMINGNPQSLPGKERLAGYRKALNHHNLPFDDNLVVICDSSKGEDGFNQASGYDAMQDMLNWPGKLPTAIFIASDVQAIGAIRAIREARLRIPQDLAIVGFDDIQFAEYLGLTTMHQPLLDVGGLAVERLIDRMHGKRNSHYEKRLKTYLVIRQTCCSTLKQTI